ncbi:MAG: hypothetical protein QM612_00155 [Thermomonas sp.]|uniref:hypothetical protein n=1 Tax=Thermomonas sp. TaxID=1971895 RepID=UPI0039E52EEE
MSIELSQLLVSILGVVIAAVGLPFVYLQLRNLNQSIRVASHAAIYEQASGFRSHLVAHPHLRKYIFDGVELLPRDPDYDQALTLAEMFLNYLEHIAVLEKNFGHENKPALDAFVTSALKRGPILRVHLADNPELYSDALRRFCHV